MKIVYKLGKVIIVGALFLYVFNLIGVKYDLIIPINIFTIGIVGFLGLPGLASLVLLFVLSF